MNASEQTWAVLEQAIANHFTEDQDGAIVTGFVLQIQGQGFAAQDEDSTG